MPCARFFCWHLRGEFAEAHRDLCVLAGIEERDSRLYPHVTQAAGHSPSAEASEPPGAVGRDGELHAGEGTDAQVSVIVEEPENE
jgi:hypothetical protein